MSSITAQMWWWLFGALWLCAFHAEFLGWYVLISAVVPLVWIKAVLEAYI